MAVNLQGVIIDEKGQPTGAGQIDVATGQPIVGSGAAFPSTITSGDLSTQPSLNLPPRPTPPDFASIMGAISNEPPTQTESTQDELNRRILDLAKSATGKGAAQIEAEKQAGLPGFQAQLRDVSSELGALTKEALSVPLQIQEEFKGRGATAAGVEPIQTERLRRNTIRALGLSAIAQILQGNIATAQATANRAVEIEFGPIEDQLAYLDRAIEINKSRLSREDQKRAEARQLAIAERSILLQEQKEEKTSIYNTSLAAAQMGASAELLNKINTAKTRGEALSMAGYYMGQEFRKKLEQEQFTRDLQKRTYDLSLDKFEQDKKQFDLDYAQKERANAIDKLKVLADLGLANGVGGAQELNLLAYAQQYAADGKLPAGAPKNSFGAISQKAKELLQPKGTIVNIHTGVKSNSVSDTLLGGYGALYSITELAGDLLKLNENRRSGIIAGTLGKFFGADDQTKYMALRLDIVDLLSRARSGAALTASEEKRYESLLPGRFAEPFFLGADTEVKLNSFINNITNDLQNKLTTQGLAIHGFSKINIQGQEFTVGDVINVNGIQGRILPDGSIVTIE